MATPLDADTRDRTGPEQVRHALVLANRLPFPLDDGWKVRTFHIVRGIASRFRTTLVVFHPAGDPSRIARAREALGPGVRLIVVAPPRAYTPSNLVRGLVTRMPVHVWNQESRAMADVVRGVVRHDRPDVLAIASTFMANYLGLVPRDVPRVVDTHNIDSVTFGRYVQSLPSGPRRWYAAATVRRLAHLERKTYRAVDAVWVCSDIERELARSGSGDVAVLTVPNGVDTSYFSPDGQTASTGSLLFFGRLDYFPNVDGLQWFVREILPSISARAETGLDVVGAAATAEVQSLASAEPSVRLVGRVEDLPSVLNRAGIIVVPLRVGGGTRLKVLEALSMARPVVSTSIGAEGIDVRDGEHLLLADSPSSFADAVLRLIQDPCLAKRLGENGRRLVRERYDWQQVGLTVGESLERVTEPGVRS